MNRNIFSRTRRMRWFAIALVALSLALWGCGTSKPQPREPESVNGVRVVTLRFQTIPGEIEAPGTVRSVTKAEIAARMMGTVQAVLVREGDAVRRGQLLVQIDESELGSRRSAAQAALGEAAAAREEVSRAITVAEAQSEVAKKTYDRFTYLRDQKSVSPQEFDEVEAKHRAASAGLEQVRARQQQVEAMHRRAESEARAAATVAGYARITAPFDGVVAQRTVEPGMMAMPGTPLLVIEEASHYRLEVTVDAAAGIALRRGAKSRVQLDGVPGRSFEGTVTEIEAGADASSHTFAAKIELPRDPAIRSGLFGRAWFPRGELQALIIPRAAVVERGQLQGVYVVGPDGLARLRIVTLGRAYGEDAEALSGLNEGDRIVAEPSRRELDGKKVAP